MRRFQLEQREVRSQAIDHVRLRDSAYKEDDKNALVKWLNTEEEIHQGLSSIKPRIAIWSARKGIH